MQETPADGLPLPPLSEEQHSILSQYFQEIEDPEGLDDWQEDKEIVILVNESRGDEVLLRLMLERRRAMSRLSHPTSLDDTARLQEVIEKKDQDIEKRKRELQDGM